LFFFDKTILIKTLTISLLYRQRQIANSEKHYKSFIMLEQFNLEGKVAVVTGATGTLGQRFVAALLGAGAYVTLIGRNKNRLQDMAQAIGSRALPQEADVLHKAQLETARQQTLEKWGRIDVLVNAAGGNLPGATLARDNSFFELSLPDFSKVVELNLQGSVLPCLAFGPALAKQSSAAIINISSMAADRPLTRVGGYAAAKAALDNFTRWMAIEMAQRYGDAVRVNAIAPGFFIAEQNRTLLLNEDETLTERGQSIIDATPMGRFGKPEELQGTLLWLASEASRFVTGTVIPVDGGFSAFSGV
jgi:NAD(P)-dependent dehydrogenase (short-subunit alcohol dehydrogenase family)